MRTWEVTLRYRTPDRIDPDQTVMLVKAGDPDVALTRAINLCPSPIRDGLIEATAIRKGAA